MKTYKTWEVIKMITENPKLKFRTRTNCSDVFKDENGYIVFENTDCVDGFDGNFKGDEEWILVQEPVDFMTAVKSGKKIKVEHQLTKCLSISEDYCNVHNIFDVLGNILNDINIREVIAEGKFYIEE